MKRVLFVATIISIFNFQFSTSHAQRVLTDDWQHLQVEFNVGDLTVGKTLLCGQTFSTLAIEGYQQSLANYGSPALPTFSQLIEVPLDAEFEVTVADATYDTLPALQHRLLPVQLPRSKSDTSEMKLLINEEVYSENAFVGQPAALVEAVGITRDRRLARLQYSPVRYNPVTGQVIVCRYATLTVTYRGADRQASLEMFNRYFSPAFNSGANPLNSLYPKTVRTTAPVRYLIVANSMFRGYLDELIQWKKRKGFLTDIVYTDNAAVGTTTTSIAAYIKSQYDNATQASPAPTYVLLVGDVAQLPAFNAQVTSPSSDHVSDLYYATWTTGDHLPDCHYGRFSAQTVAQLTPQVQKTLMYEQYTFADPSFLDRAVMVAGVDGGSAGDYGYTHADPTMDYAVTNYVNGTHGWSQVMYFKNDVTIIPACTTNVTIGSSASGNAATVRSYYNQGAGFINYSAHGGSTGWGTPSFGNTHVNSMTNNQKFGLMIGNCCLTNKFEESTCFGEALLRKNEYAGAVGYIGGSNSTYWGQDVYWAVGVRNSISASMSMAYDASHLGVYDRTFHTHGESYSNWCTTQGSMVMQGNMSVESSSTSTNMKWYYWEIYHLMGDPSVMPYMTQASTMNVAMTSVVNYGTTSLPVSAVPYAYIALSDTVTGTLIAAAYADASGNATLTLPSDLAVNTYLLAASAQQRRTAFVRVTVIQPSGPFPLVTDITSAPFNAGDTIPLTLHLENPGNATAHNITIQLSSNNPNLSFLSSGLSATQSLSLTLDSLAAGASVDLPAAATAYVADNAPDNIPVDITATNTWTGATVNAASTLRRWIYAPMLTVTFSPDCPSLLPGATATLTATLVNSGHAPTHPNALTFSSPTSLLSLTANSASQTLAPDASQSFSLTLQASAQLPQNIHIPLTYSFGSFSGELPVFIGQSFMETFEGGHTNLPGWNAPAAYPWAVSTELPYEGSYCLRSVQYTSHNTSSDMSLNITVTAADSVSFYYRVSSENNYDKFHFLIDSVSQFNASGEVDWTRAAFPLTPGSHILTFRYQKDYSVSNGSDCAWIDNLVLPHTTVPVTFVHIDTCSNLPIPVQNTVAPNGNVTITEYTLHPLYNVATEIVACDSLLWQGTLYTASTVVGDSLLTAFGCDSIIGITLTVNHSSLGDTTFITTLANTFAWNGTTYDTSGIYQQTLTNSVGCDSIATLVLSFSNTQGIDDIDIQNSKLEIEIYPNPATNTVTIEASSSEPLAVTIVDLTGRTVLNQAIKQSDNQTTTLDVSSLTPGLYLLRITTPQGTATRRLVIQ